MPAIITCGAGAEATHVEDKSIKFRYTEFLYTADDKEAILAWGKRPLLPRQPGDPCRVLEYEHGNNHVIVLLRDSGSGYFCEHIYFFGKKKEMTKWYLVLYYPARTSSIALEVHQENGKLVIVSEDLSMEQPFATLVPFGESEAAAKTISVINPFNCKNKEAISTWGKQMGNCQHFEFSHGGSDAIVLLQDIGDGAPRNRIFVFGKSKEMERWYFVLFRPTFTEVKVYQENSKLVFKTITDDVILEQSLEVLW